MDTVSDFILESQVAILTGGVDKEGTPLITFPTDVGDLVDIYSLGDILRLLQICVRLAGGKVAILADFRYDWTPEGISKLMTLLDELQMGLRRCLTVVYLVKPRARRKGNILYRELSRKYGPGRMVPFYNSMYERNSGQRFDKKQSEVKRNICSDRFAHLTKGGSLLCDLDAFEKVKRLENHEELYNYIDKIQLTPDYGGTIQYDHSAWIRFHKVFYPVITKAEKMLSDIPSVKDGVIKLLESAKKIRIDDDTNSKEIHAKYEHLMSKSHVREVSEDCISALTDIESRSNASCYQIHSSLLVKTTKDISTLSSKISAEINEMDSMLISYTRMLDIHSKLRQCKEHADEIIDSIILLNEELKCLPVIGQSIADAQCYRQGFIEEILNPSKDIVACSTVILKQLDSGKDTTPKSYAVSFEIAKQLTEALQPFIQIVNNMNEIYTRTHLFFVLLEKVKRWNSRASLFILKNTDIVCNTNEVISSRCKEESIYENSEKLLNENISPIGHSLKLRNRAFTDVWPALLGRFTQKHPIPKRRHLKFLTKNIPDGIVRRFRDEANNLVERTIFILSFLDKDGYKSEDLALIRKWCQSPYRTKNDCEWRKTNEVSAV